MSAAWRVLPLLAVTLLAGCLAPGFEVGCTHGKPLCCIMIKKH